MALPLVGLAVTAAGIGALAQIAVKAIFVYLGVTIIGTGATLLLLNQAGDVIRDALMAIPSPYANILGILRFDEAVNIILMGFSIRLTMMGFRRLRLI